MKLPKTKRKIDLIFLQSIREKPCLVCGKRPSDPDHMSSVGAGGDDDQNNVWPLCRQHHRERHDLGIETFISKHHLEYYLRDHGWEVVNGKWMKMIPV